jgi:hypothetical protein
MFTGSAQHDWFAGSVGIVDPTGGFNFPDGLKKVTADVPWPESGNGPVDPVESADYHPSGRYTAYYSPYPLSERDFLVSACRNDKFVLYLMDVDGNRELIYEGTNHIFHALPLKPRRRPPVIADRVAWPRRDERLKRAAVGFVPWRKLPACEFAGKGKLEARPTGKFSSAARLRSHVRAIVCHWPRLSFGPSPSFPSASTAVEKMASLSLFSSVGLNERSLSEMLAPPKPALSISRNVSVPLTPFGKFHNAPSASCLSGFRRCSTLAPGLAG